jgi:hypothetical protein
MSTPATPAISHPLNTLESYFIALAQYAIGYVQGTQSNGAFSAAGAGSVFGNEGNADSKFQHSSLSEIRFSCLTNQDSVDRGSPDNCGPEAREFVLGLRKILEQFPTVNGDIRSRTSEVYSYLMGRGDALARQIVEQRKVKDIAKAVIQQMKEDAAKLQEEELAQLEKATAPST